MGDRFLAKKRDGLTQQGEATRQAIIVAAEKHFAKQGFAATRLEDIAEDANIRAATLLYYFSSKQALYDEMDKAIFRSAEEIIKSYLLGCDTPHDRLVALTNAWLDFLTARPSVAKIYQRNLAGSSMQHPPREFSGAAKDRFINIVSTGQSAGVFRQTEPTHLLHIIGGSIISFVCMESWKGAPIPEASVEAFRATLHALVRLLLIQEE